MGIIQSKSERVAKGVVHMGLSSKVHDGVDLFTVENMHNQIWALNIPFDESEIVIFPYGAQIVQGSAIIKLVKDDNLQGSNQVEWTSGQGQCFPSKRTSHGSLTFQA